MRDGHLLWLFASLLSAYRHSEVSTPIISDRPKANCLVRRWGRNPRILLRPDSDTGGGCGPGHNLHTQRSRDLSVCNRAAPQGGLSLPRQAPHWRIPNSNAEPLTPSSGVGQNRFSPGTDCNHRRSLAARLSLEQHILPARSSHGPFGTVVSGSVTDPERASLVRGPLGGLAYRIYRELERASMERGLRAPLCPHEEVTLRRVALGISKAKLLPARDVAHLIRLCLIDEKDGRLSLTALGRQRYQGLPRPAAWSPHGEDEVDAVLRSHLRQARDN